MAFTNNAAPSRVGQIEGANDVDALFLKVFSGEILTTFEEKNVMKDLHMVRTIQNGKSAQFPVTGIATAGYHTPGESLVEGDNGYLSDIQKNEKIITIDDVLVASTFLANIDELKTHYDVRSIYAQELGKALAKRFDIATMKTLIAAARSGANISGQTLAGSTVQNATTDTAAGLIDALFAVAQTLDEKDAPDEGRYAILTPEQYYTLLTTDNVAISKDFGPGGSVAAGSIPMVAGISLYKSNHLSDIIALGDDSGVSTGDGSANNDVFGDAGVGYNGDFSTLAGAGSGAGMKGFIAGTKEAIGTVKLLDLATESDYQIERQGSLFVAKYAMGHGVLRPECAVEVTPPAS
jgi:hypothetical protein